MKQTAGSRSSTEVTSVALKDGSRPSGTQELAGRRSETPARTEQKRHVVHAFFMQGLQQPDKHTLSAVEHTIYTYI